MPSGTGTAQSLATIDLSRAYSVSELSQNIKQAFTENPRFNDILLKGEVSNFSRAASGHVYFSLRDENCAIACAFFKKFQEIECDIDDGTQVVAMGSVTTYEPRSQYQLSIKKILPIGDGASSVKLQRLRKKLENEGLFREDRKRPIPQLPRKVGIITSKNSAAIPDILTVVNSRCPKMNLVMAYAAIQGEDAPRGIIQALERLATIEEVDTIILARGGGPAEDFAAFNDEEVVRAISSCSKAIVTGIGHEGDTSLVDLAADLRASTPSTAAKAAIPNIQEMKNNLDTLSASLDRSYDSYRKGVEIRSLKDGSDTFKYKAAIVVLIALLMLLVVLLLRGTI